jgi:hypothetical protein
MSSNRSPPSSSSPFGPPIALHVTSPWIGRAVRRAGERTVDLAAVADVAGLHVRRALDARGRLAEVVLVPRHERRRRALARQPQRDGAPDSRPCARDHHVLARHLTSLVRNLRALRRQIPLQGPARKRRLPLRRARDATRTKPSREAVRGSGRSAGEVDESAPGSANPWSCSCRAHGARRKCVSHCKEKFANCEVWISDELDAVAEDP